MQYSKLNTATTMHYYCCCVYYRQHCAQRKATIHKLLSARFWGFSPGRRDTLHGWGWNLARRSTFPCQISPHRCNDKATEPPKLKILLKFDQTSEYKRPTGEYPVRDFHKMCRIFTTFHTALAVKILMNLLKGLRSYGGFKLTGSSSSSSSQVFLKWPKQQRHQIFSAP